MAPSRKGLPIPSVGISLLQPLLPGRLALVDLFFDIFLLQFIFANGRWDRLEQSPLRRIETIPPIVFDLVTNFAYIEYIH